MSEHLLLMSVGPVQDFIAQARRTRDLWFGSHLLSEISKAAALALSQQPNAELIFPALDPGHDALRPQDTVRGEDGARPYNVANRILVRVSGDPRRAAEAARDAARERLLRLADHTLDKEAVQSLLMPDPETGSMEATRERARAQIAGLLEIHVLWTELSGDRTREARQQLEDAMAARKAIHAFTPWREQRGGLLKSSLDGGRETVLRQDDREGLAWRRYQIGLREQLDAVGLLKRTGGTSAQFIPVPNIGLGPWLERAAERVPERMRAIQRECKQLRFTGVRYRAGKGERADQVAGERAWIRAFSYDAQLFLPERWEPYFADNGFTAVEGARFGRAFVQPVLDRMPEPYPYVACIVADGDRMGNTIDGLAGKGLVALRHFSARLSEFAGRAHEIVEREHRGVLVYAGGDDVLAFVCVQDALSCARALREAFSTTVSLALEEVGAHAPAPTLSVGLGIAHVLQSMGRILDLGRAAETMAKHEAQPDGATRNALAVRFERHSGSLRAWHASWDQDPCARLAADVALLWDGILSRSKVHEVAGALRRAPEPGAVHDDPARWREVLRGETARILARTESGRGPEAVTPARVGLDLDRGDYTTCHASIARWVERMRIAGELARAQDSLVFEESAS